MKATEFCCEFMNKFLKDQRVSVNYDAKHRGYGLCLRYSSSIQLLYYCPWCGTKFPEELSDEWFDILKNEYGFEDPYKAERKKEVPEEFLGDEWWKKRQIKKKKKWPKKSEWKKRDLLEEIYEKKIDISDVGYIYSYAKEAHDAGQLPWSVQEYLGFSDLENKAIEDFHVSLNAVSDWRYNDWPNSCAICEKELDVTGNEWASLVWVMIDGEWKRDVLFHKTCYLKGLSPEKQAQFLEQHCCRAMKFFLHEERVSLGYHSISRSYYIDPDYPKFSHIPYYRYARQTIYYCPWCGTELPEALNDTFFDVLQKDEPYNLLDEENGQEPPKEFKSDQWWKKRKL